jgi:decaprenylphospho-beta-D-ribofuranose 2-oxidase
LKLPTPPSETVELVSFDGGVTATCERWRPDRYRMIEASGGVSPRIARGGGYSYAAASFGARSLVLDMTRFDRVMSFDEDRRRTEVQAGTTLETVLSITGPRNLMLSVQPGYPQITIGGCIAANVHGKNPFLEGTFAHQVESLTLFHPRYGTLEISRRSSPDLFHLTCGGLGLTGVILSATLRLQAVPGFSTSVERTEIGSLSEGLHAARSLTEGSAFAYTWHDGVPHRSSFGRGFVYRGRITPGKPYPTARRRYRRIDAATRRNFPLSLLRDSTARLLTWGFWATERFKRRTIDMPLFDAIFPFARRSEYFLLFGRRGLAEAQVIVPDAQIEGFLGELQALLLRERPGSVMISMKLFRGEPRLLCFEGSGVCVTIDFARSSATTKFLGVFDEMCVTAGALPNLIKDSRIPLEVVRRCYPGYEEFRDRIQTHDPERLFRSELSQRLGL